MATNRHPHRSASRISNTWASWPDAQRHKRERFNVDNGQIFTEITVSVRRPDVDERTRLDALFADNRARRRQPGAPSLENIAIRTLLQNLEAVNTETLMGLPWEIGARLWRKIEDLDLSRPSVWAAFTAAYPNQEEFRYYRASEITPTKAFSEYIEFLESPRFEWLTSLTLSKINLAHADVMRISELSNIVSMDIYSSTSELDQFHGIGISIIDDQVVRNWGRRARESGSFSKLRVMILRNQHHLTARCFEYLWAFPALVLLAVSGCALTKRHGETAQKHGWTLDDDHDILSGIKRDIDKSYTWDGALSSCVKHSASLLGKHTCDDVERSDPPILSYRLGPTSSDVLYSVPLVFFRCFDRVSNSELQDSDEVAEFDNTITPTIEPTQICFPSGHQDKKRKIKVSAKRSFDCTLAEFGINIASTARPGIPAKSNSDSSIEQASPSQSQLQSQKAKPASTPATPSNPLANRRQARQERERPWRQASSQNDVADFAPEESPSKQ